MEYESIVKPPTSQRLKSGRVKLSLGENVGAHETTKKEEVLVILRGTATVTVEGEAHAVVAGETFYIGEGKRHDVKNNAGEALEYVYTVALLDGE